MVRVRSRVEVRLIGRGRGRVMIGVRVGGEVKVGSWGLGWW